MAGCGPQTLGDCHARGVHFCRSRQGDQTEAIVTFDRRRFVRLMMAAGAGAGASLLQACAPAAPTAPATSAPGNPTPAAAKPTAASGAAPTSAPANTAAPTSAAVQKPATTPAGSRTVQLPNRFPLASIKPDLAPSADGLIDAAFINYPANSPKTVPDTPGGAAKSQSPPGPPARRRRRWSPTRCGRRSTKNLVLT